MHDGLLRQIRAAPRGDALCSMLTRQDHFVRVLSTVAAVLKSSGESRPKRIGRLRDMFDDPTSPLHAFRALDVPLRLPINPHACIVGAAPEVATVFKSALLPLGVTFDLAREMPLPTHSNGAVVSCGGSYRGVSARYSLIFKSGDDLRQDQLVLEMLRLIDSLLKEQGLDLRLTTYRVLATAPFEGLVERVPDCMPLAQVLAENRNDIRRYLQSGFPDAASPHGVAPVVLQNFVKSCAGYCVTMYAMGVGDRHLDNLMLCSDGTLFHIDFGFIFGRDPKPFPPPMKMCKEMVEAMGGAHSAESVSRAFSSLAPPLPPRVTRPLTRARTQVRTLSRAMCRGLQYHPRVVAAHTELAHSHDRCRCAGHPVRAGRAEGGDQPASRFIQRGGCAILPGTHLRLCLSAFSCCHRNRPPLGTILAELIEGCAAVIFTSVRGRGPGAQ